MDRLRTTLYVALLAATPAHAAQICFFGQDIDVPATIEGIYLNLQNGMRGFTEGSVPGFDFNPYAAPGASNGLRFYWGATAAGNAGVASSGNIYAVLPSASVIGAANPYTDSGSAGTTANWTAGVTSGFLGVRFRNEITGLINYGGLHISTTAPLGFPMTVHSWCYEDSGGTAVIGPLPLDELFDDGFDP